jgi:hypothetical protein
MLVFAAEGLSKESRDYYRRRGQLLEPGEKPRPWFGPDGRAQSPIVVKLDTRPGGIPPADIDEERTRTEVAYGGNVIPFRDPAYDWGDE